MEQTIMIRGTSLFVACFCIAWTTISCSKENDTGKSNVEVGAGSPADAVVAIEASKKQAQLERLEAECRRIVSESELKRENVVIAICDLCKEISELPRDEALPLLDRWMETAIEQPVTNVGYSIETKLPEKLFHIFFFSFMTSQNMRSNSFDHWDKMFRFFAKYIDEISSVEKHINERGVRWPNPSYRYLHDLQVHVENWVYMITIVYRDVLLDRGLTEEQKADILHRLDEVKKHTVPPPHSPFGKSEWLGDSSRSRQGGVRW